MDEIIEVEKSSISAQREDGGNRVKQQIELMRANDVTPDKLAGLWNHRFHRGKPGFIAVSRAWVNR